MDLSAAVMGGGDFGEHAGHRGKVADIAADDTEEISNGFLVRRLE